MKQISSLNCTENCKFQQRCANHSSANDLRREGGFTPEIIIKNDVIHCKTIERNAKKELFGIVVPEDYEQLGMGVITRTKKGNLVKGKKLYVLPEDRAKAAEELLVASDLLEEKGLLYAANTLRELT